MPYYFSDSLEKVPGIGPATASELAGFGINSILDFLLFVPLRYEDRSHISTISQLQPEETYTIRAKIESIQERFKPSAMGKIMRISEAVISDETGSTKCVWFNNRFIKGNLREGELYFFAGKFSKYRNFTQPIIETISQSQAHTGRLVPIYSSSLKLKEGNIRRWLKKITDDLVEEADTLPNEIVEKHDLLSLSTALKQLHFPEEEKLVVKARERLAIEELLALIDQSKKIKAQWNKQKASLMLGWGQAAEGSLPPSIPFKLTGDQHRALKEILSDMTQPHPMNRLLVGDVGTGKTVVAGLAAWHTLRAGKHAALIAPTQILAEQHLSTFAKLFPNLKLELLTGKTSDQLFHLANQSKNPTLFIGTHAVINKLEKIQPALIIYDEQHRFGVEQRSASSTKLGTAKQPHILTMSATPIPRSYMLTIFSHLDLSLISESPFGDKPIKTWFLPKHKKADSYQWLFRELADPSTNQNHQNLAMVVCPFIETSTQPGFEEIPAAHQVYQQLKKDWGEKIKIALLHGKQKQAQQEKIVEQLFKQEIDLLVTTTIVEVGVDLPQAKYMLIEGADRFGLASLHQLRGRVGRQGQEAFCILFSSSGSQTSKKRLKLFAKEKDGLKLAELDLENRGPGDLFGLEQSGFQDLRFASWNNARLIIKAQEIYKQVAQQVGFCAPALNSLNKGLSHISHLS